MEEKDTEGRHYQRKGLDIFSIRECSMAIRILRASDGRARKKTKPTIKIQKTYILEETRLIKLGGCYLDFCGTNSGFDSRKIQILLRRIPGFDVFACVILCQFTAHSSSVVQNSRIIN